MNNKFFCIFVKIFIYLTYCVCFQTTKDAHIISVQINFYYGETSDSRKKLLELFSRQPDTFEYMDLIEELKKLQQSHSHLFEFDDN